MNPTQRVIAVAVGALSASALALPTAPAAVAAPKSRPATTSSATWTAPWATTPAPGPCADLARECASTTVTGDLRAVAGPAGAGTISQSSAPATHERRAAVVIDDVVGKSGVTAQSYTATVVVHDVATSGAGYADLEARLVAAPAECAGSCTVSGGRVRVAAGDRTLSGPATVTLSFRVEIGWWSALTVLPAGAYTIEVGAVAGIVQQEAEFNVPMPCMADACYWYLGGVHAGIGTADIAATVQKVVR